jgi:hypothetical protein
MPLRLLRYVVRILESHVQDAATPSLALPLPLVIPVVLHHSETGWTAARSPEGRSMRHSPTIPKYFV